jgi:hypothetical protein
VDDDAVFGGVDGPRCPRAPANSPPRALLINKGSASGVFQDDFKNGEVQHSECRRQATGHLSPTGGRCLTWSFGQRYKPEV